MASPTAAKGAASPKSPASPPPSSPQGRQSPMSSGSVTDAEFISQVLHNRAERVTEVTQHVYEGDIIAPTTKSQIIRAQKFSVIYYYMMNVIFFAYAFALPSFTKAPMFGGLYMENFEFHLGKVIVFCVLLIIPLVRFLVMSWDTEFYQFAALLIGVELVLLVLTALWWSPGMPVLLILLFANLLNMGVSQIYWKKQFVKVVEGLGSLVPPAPYKVKDHTHLPVFSGFAMFYEEFSRLMGLKKPRSQATLYDERCGVFTTKESMSHVKAMTHAYNQAAFPATKTAPWKRGEDELWQLNLFGLLDGMLNTFCTNGAYSIAGLWLGEVMFQNWGSNGIIAVVMSVTMMTVGFLSMRRLKFWLHDSVGIAVAEKAWLAHDIVKHTAQREELAFEVLDVSANSPLVLESRRDDADGRLNIVFMWLAMTSIAEFIGESYLAKLYWNISIEVRYMIEAMTPYDYRLFYHAKWDVTRYGTLLKCFQNLMFVAISCVYFGTYFDKHTPPVLLVASIAAATFLQSCSKMVEAVQYAFTILGQGTTDRHKWVSEWIVGVCLMVLLTNTGIWLYLVPIMKSGEPMGSCSSSVNQYLFPSSCMGK